MSRRLRRVVWLAFTCFLLCGHVAAAAELSVTGDLDGDGKRDRVTFDRADPQVLKVWLSSANTTWTVRTRIPIVRIVVKDLDGDHRAELIARGKAPGLLVWTAKKHKGIRTFRPRRTTAPSVSRSTRHTVRNESPETTSGAESPGSSAVPLLLSSQPRAPAPVASTRVETATPAPRRHFSFDALAPRPPPATTL